MKRKLVFLYMMIVIGFCFTTSMAYAVNIQYGLGADDYGQLNINNSTLLTQQSSAWGMKSGSISLAEGWYAFSLDYKNRWGSDGLFLYWDAGTGGTAYGSIVPEAYFRSKNSNGQFISGLKADYYWLDANKNRGAFIQTIYGEGPIAHGHMMYENVTSGAINTSPWPTVGYGGQFEEVLTGEIYIGTSPPPPPAVPEPATMLLFSLGLFGLAGVRRKLKK